MSVWFSDGWYAILIEGDKSRYKKIVRDYEAYQNKHHPSGIVDIINAYVTISGDNSLDNILSKKEIEQNFDLLRLLAIILKKVSPSMYDFIRKIKNKVKRIL